MEEKQQLQAMKTIRFRIMLTMMCLVKLILLQITF